MNKEHFGLKNIDHFIVTDHSIAGVLGFEAAMLIHNTPRNGTVVHCGSGSYRHFENDLSDMRPDLKIVSIDPTLGLPFTNDYPVPGLPFAIEKNPYVIEEHAYPALLYRRKSIRPTAPESYIHEYEAALEFQRKRKAILNKLPSTVAGLAPYLPLADESVDLFIDSVGPIHYLPSDDLRKEYFTNIMDVLKPKGTAYLHPISKDVSRFIKQLGRRNGYRIAGGYTVGWIEAVK